MTTNFHNFDDFWNDEIGDETPISKDTSYLALAKRIFNKDIPEDIVKILVDCHKIGNPDEILNYLLNLNFTSDEITERDIINLLKTQLLCLTDDLLLININGMTYFKKYEEYSVHSKDIYIQHPFYKHLYVNFIKWYNVYRFNLSLDEVINKFKCVLDSMPAYSPFQLVLIREAQTEKYIRFRKYESVVKDKPALLIIQHSKYPCLWYIPANINEKIQSNIKALMEKLK